MVPKLVRTRPAALLGMGGSLCRISAACVETLFTTIELTGGRFLLARGKTIATVARAEETVLPRHPGARVSGVEIRSRLRIFRPAAATAGIRIECADLAQIERLAKYGQFPVVDRRLSGDTDVFSPGTV